MLDIRNMYTPGANFVQWPGVGTISCIPIQTCRFRQNRPRKYSAILILGERQMTKLWRVLPFVSLQSFFFFCYFKLICLVGELPFRFFKSVHLYFRLFTCISATHTRRVSAKFDTGNFYGNLSRQFTFVWNGAKISDTLHEELSTFYCFWRI